MDDCTTTRCVAGPRRCGYMSSPRGERELWRAALSQRSSPYMVSAADHVVCSPHSELIDP